MAEGLSPSSYESYIRKHETWNFAVNFLDLTFFNLAMSFIFGATVLSLYTSYLTESALLIGLIPAVQNVGFYLPQLLLAHSTERLVYKKPLVLKISVMERLPYLAVALAILLWPGAPHWFSYLLLGLCLSMATLAGGLAAPGWKAMLAKVIPIRRRGILFGASQAAGGLLGLAGAAVSSRVLANYPYPTSFGICFLLAFVFQVFSWTVLSLNREPPLEPTKEPVALPDYLRRLPNVLRSNPNFTRYLISRALTVLGSMAGSFYIIYARRTFEVTDAFAANLTMAALLSTTLSTPLLGHLADRRGHKWLMERCALIGIATIVLATLAPSAPWFYAVFMLMSAAGAGMSVASLSVTMEFSAQDDIPTFTALADTLIAIPVLLSPLLAGWLVDVTGFKAMFIVALVFLILGWGGLRWAVRDPRFEAQTAS